MSTNAISSPPAIRGVWKAAHAAVGAMPRWARLAAYALPSTVLPSSLRRIAAYTVHVPIADGSTHAPSGVPGVSLEVSVVSLSLVSELAAFTGVRPIPAGVRWSRAACPCWAAAPSRSGPSPSPVRSAR
jgi:hypothetical protein